MRKYSILIFFLTFAGCNQEEPLILKDVDGVILSKPALWTTLLSKNNRRVITITDNAIVNNTVVVSGWNGKRDGLIGVDANTGEKLWEWYDDFEFYNLYVNRHYISSSYLIWQQGKELYCIDMISGSTIFKKRYENEPYLRSVTGMDGDIYVIADSYMPNDKSSPSNARLYHTSLSENGILTELAQPTHNGIKYSNLNNYSLSGSATVVRRIGQDFVLFNTIDRKQKQKLYALV